MGEWWVGDVCFSFFCTAPTHNIDYHLPPPTTYQPERGAGEYRSNTGILRALTLFLGTGARAVWPNAERQQHEKINIGHGSGKR